MEATSEDRMRGDDYSLAIAKLVEVGVDVHLNRITIALNGKWHLNRVAMYLNRRMTIGHGVEKAPANPLGQRRPNLVKA
jgi:hypothetical protein